MKTFKILLGQWQGFFLEIPYGCFRVFSPFLPYKHRQGGFFFRFEDGPSKFIPYHKAYLEPPPMVPLYKIYPPKLYSFQGQKEYIFPHSLSVMDYDASHWGRLSVLVCPKKKEDLSCCIPNVSCIYHPFYKCAQSLYNHLKKGKKSLFYAVMCNQTMQAGTIQPRVHWNIS